MPTMQDALTKKEICQILRRRGWHRSNWRWINLRRSYPAFAKQGISLREAASLEALLASESLTERPKRTGPSLAEYRKAEANLALSRASIVTCARCGWPVWQDEKCGKCGHTTK